MLYEPKFCSLSNLPLIELEMLTTIWSGMFYIFLLGLKCTKLWRLPCKLFIGQLHWSWASFSLYGNKIEGWFSWRRFLRIKSYGVWCHMGWSFYTVSYSNRLESFLTEDVWDPILRIKFGPYKEETGARVNCKVRIMWCTYSSHNILDMMKWSNLYVCAEIWCI